MQRQLHLLIRQLLQAGAQVGVVWCVLEVKALDVGVDGQQRICGRGGAVVDKETYLGK